MFALSELDVCGADCCFFAAKAIGVSISAYKNLSKIVHGRDIIVDYTDSI